MKLLIAAIILISSTQTFAGEKYICKEKKESWESKTSFILTQIGDATLKEGEKYSFQLEVFEGNSGRPLLSEKVTVQTEDVMFGFKNSAKKITGMIYLDELDASYLTIKGKTTHFDCN